jgi:hypothetical protein
MLKALLIFAKYDDRHRAQQAAGDFFASVQCAPEDQKEQLLAMWSDAGLPPPETPNTASTD